MEKLSLFLGRRRSWNVSLHYLVKYLVSLIFLTTRQSPGFYVTPCTITVIVHCGYSMRQPLRGSVDLLRHRNSVPIAKMLTGASIRERNERKKIPPRPGGGQKS